MWRANATTIVALAVAVIAGVFAIWPAVADAPWEDDAEEQQALLEDALGRLQAANDEVSVLTGRLVDAEQSLSELESDEAASPLLPFNDCYMGAGDRNCGIVHPESQLVCVNPGPFIYNAGCDQFAAVPFGSVRRDFAQDTFDASFTTCVQGGGVAATCLQSAKELTRMVWCPDLPTSPICN